MAVTEYLAPDDGEEVFEATVRFRTVGDADCTGCRRVGGRDRSTR